MLNTKFMDFLSYFFNDLFLCFHAEKMEEKKVKK